MLAALCSGALALSAPSDYNALKAMEYPEHWPLARYGVSNEDTDLVPQPLDPGLPTLPATSKTLVLLSPAVEGSRSLHVQPCVELPEHAPLALGLRTVQARCAPRDTVHTVARPPPPPL